MSGLDEMLSCAREVLDVEIEGLAAVRDNLGQAFADVLELFASTKGRVVITGIGKSGLVGRKMAATLASLGTPSFFLHPVEGAHGDLGMLRKEDSLLAISNSGETDELNAILPAIKSLGVPVVGMTRDPESSLARFSDVVLPVAVPREACPMGLAPTASTTAALAVGDALAVCLMRLNSFDQQDFRRVHPGGSLGRRLSKTVASLMHAENLPVCAPEASLGQALGILDKGGLGLAVVVDDSGLLSGVLSDGDVRRMVCGDGLDPRRAVKEVMTRDPKRVHTDDSSASALDLMEQSQITVLPVVDASGLLRGIIHLHDLLGKGSVRFAASEGDGA